MCIEAYLAVNLAADLVLLCVVSRALGLFRWRRVLAADVVCAAYAAFASARPVPWAAAPVQLAMLALVAMLLAGDGSLRRWPTVGLSLISSALICGGTARLLPVAAPDSVPVGIALGCALMALLLEARPPDVTCWQVRLCLCAGGRTARFPALIDTGNRLREPLSGLPVIIAERALVKELLPTDGCRTLRFGAVGGDGEMTCFKPGRVWIERGRHKRRAPEVWVAVAPGRLPGQCQALAPSEFARYIK